MAQDSDWTIRRLDLESSDVGQLSREEMYTRVFIRFTDSGTGEERVVQGENLGGGKQLFERVVPKGGVSQTRMSMDEAQTLANEAAYFLSTPAVRHSFTLGLDKSLTHRSGNRPAGEISEGDSVDVEDAFKRPLYVIEITRVTDAGTISVMLGDDEYRRRRDVESKLLAIETDQPL
jgi:hypothetical protein